MVAIKNVAIVGASGNLGPSVLKALIDSGKFNLTILKRASSSSTFPSSVKVIPVDFDSVSELTEALKGQDAVVANVALPSGNTQSNLLEAAVAAGVYRFLPSEFGCDLTLPKVAQLPVFGEKVALVEKLKEAAAKSSQFTYTLLRNNVFLDWGLKVPFIFDVSQGTPTIYDSGDSRWAATRLSTVGQAVVGVLTHPEETKNRPVLVKDIDLSANQLLTIAKKNWPEKTWNPAHAPTSDVLENSLNDLKTGNIGPLTFVSQIAVAAFGDGWATAFEKNDNELLGIKGLTEEEFAKEWKSYV